MGRRAREIQPTAEPKPARVLARPSSPPPLAAPRRAARRVAPEIAARRAERKARRQEVIRKIERALVFAVSDGRASELLKYLDEIVKIVRTLAD